MVRYGGFTAWAEDSIRRAGLEGKALTMDDVLRVTQALGAIRCGASATEEELHAQVAQALCAAGLEPVHEARLAPRCRIDFMVGDIGVEIKKKRPERTRLMAQLARYAACAQVRALIVVAPCGVNLPRTIGGKPVTMLALERLWGISLP